MFSCDLLIHQFKDFQHIAVEILTQHGVALPTRLVEHTHYGIEIRVDEQALLDLFWQRFEKRYLDTELAHYRDAVHLHIGRERPSQDPRVIFELALDNGFRARPMFDIRAESVLVYAALHVEHLTWLLAEHAHVFSGQLSSFWSFDFPAHHRHIISVNEYETVCKLVFPHTQHCSTLRLGDNKQVQ